MDQRYRECLKHELLCEHECEDQEKDILIVVRDQLPYIKECVESIFSTTENCTLHIWDNASAKPTRDFLESLEPNPHVRLYRSEENLGFIEPNNRLAEQSTAPYLILLNSDTKVSEGWDQAMLGYLQLHE
jgi:GT2 family glycosyltransferase